MSAQHLHDGANQNGASDPGTGHAAPPDTTRLGHLLGPQGVQGAVKLYVLGDPEQLRPLKRVYVESRGWLTLRRTERVGPGVALHLAGVGTREAAEELRGLQVYAADAELPPLEEGSFYYHDLRGLPVYAGGAELGRVQEVFDGGHQDLLVVEHAGGNSLLPLQAPYVLVPLVNGKPARIELAPDAPAGLLGEAEEAGAEVEDGEPGQREAEQSEDSTAP